MTASEFKNTILAVLNNNEFIEDSKSIKDYSKFLVGVVENVDAEGKEYEAPCGRCKEPIDLSCANFIGYGNCFCDECIAFKLDEVMEQVEQSNM